MNLLLDTHIWLWSLLEPERLSRRVTAALTEKGARLWVSPLSVWEALLLIERKRIQVDAPAERWIREALDRAPVEEAPITREVAFASRRFTTRHRDPVDRFLAATAEVFELTLVTADRQLAALKGIEMLVNVSPRASRPSPK